MPHLRLRVTRNLGWQKLEGNETMQPGILGLVDHAHPAAPKFFDDAVV